MRLVSFGAPGAERPGVVRGDRILPAADLVPGCTSVRGILADGLLDRLAESAAAAPAGGIALDSVRLGPPVTDPGQIICVGLNYHGHAAEQKAVPPERPLLFAKGRNTLSGLTDAIVIPDPDCGPDYEVELAVVVGRPLRRADPAEARAAVAGFMVANDVSARRWQKADGQWFRAKSCDGFLPCGPWLTTADEVGDERTLRLTTTINGECLQDGTPANLIHPVGAVLAWISRTIRLEPGDLILTGTPAGVGVWRTPPRFLRPGEVVECAIDRLGALRNPVVAG
jgi:2-keto-4-pentenoate hydratase/2-oxohepta-3-ene-1,7-dioic acid hydratase in catechol pathway